MSNVEIGLHENQMKVYRSAARFICLNCGRRFGKTWFSAAKVIISALGKADGIYWLLSPTFSQTDIMWRMVLKLLPKKYVKTIYLGKLYIELKNGSTIWAKSAEKYDNLRGEGLDGVVLDEAAMIHPDAWFKVVRPALMDKKGWAMFCTTPRGKNWYYRLFQKGVKGSASYKPNWESFAFSSHDNPFLDREEINEIVEDLSELEYEQEILAIFLSDGGTVFKNIDSCTRSHISDTPVPGRIYTMGVDLGRHQDFTVITVGDPLTKEIIYFERFNKTAWAYVRSRIKAVYEKYFHPPLFLDTTGVGDAIQEDLEAEGILVQSYKFTIESKRQLVNRLAIAFHNCSIFIPHIPVLREELESFTYITTDAGNIKYGAPRGFFDDCVCSLMLCNYGMNGGVALCMGGFDTELTQEEYDKQFEGKSPKDLAALALNEALNGNSADDSWGEDMFNWETDSISAAGMDDFDSSVFEEYDPVYGKRQREQNVLIL